MFHIARNPQGTSLLGAFAAAILAVFPPETVAQEPHYDPDSGFRPAQTNLTEISLQLAGSLEHHGSPIPYLRHVGAEHDRIATTYRERLGKEMAPYLPAYMDDEYIDGLAGSWDELSPKLELERLASRSGAMMSLAIEGEDGQGTSLVLLFNQHQDRIFEEMVSGDLRTVGFEQLKEGLLGVAAGREADLLAGLEEGLGAEERAAFGALVARRRFTRADFPALEAFYDGPYDRLSEHGRALLSARVSAGQRGEDVPESEAERHSAGLEEEFLSLFGKLEDQLPADVSERLIRWVCGVLEEVAFMAQTELELGIQEWSLERQAR